MPFTLSSLVQFLETHTIEETYEVFGFDYEAEHIHERINKGYDLHEEFSDEQFARNESRRISFLEQFSWQEGCTVTHEIIRRVFNQVNTFYAEKWALSNLAVDPEVFIKDVSQLILYRQGKTKGFRIRDIAFGTRTHTDFMDPFRAFKLLRGIAPAYIGHAVKVWAEVVNNVRPEPSAVTFLSSSLVAIHPLPDGNGRLGRIAFTWLTKRYGLEEQWLAEDSNGEFLRTGFGINSTDNFMAMSMLELCGGNNRIEFGYGAKRTEEQDEQAVSALETQLRNITKSASGFAFGEAFRHLLDHLQTDRHFRPSSPRFESLRLVLKQ